MVNRLMKDAFEIKITCFSNLPKEIDVQCVCHKKDTPHIYLYGCIVILSEMCFQDIWAYIKLISNASRSFKIQRIDWKECCLLFKKRKKDENVICCVLLVE